MEVRFALAAVILFCCGMFGKSLVITNRRRAKLLSEWMDGLQMLQVHMLDYLLPIRTALERSQFSVLRALEEQTRVDCVSAGWNRFREAETTRGGKLDCLSETDLTVLNRLFESLGVTAKEEQRQAFAAAIRELGRLESEARGEYQKKGRLYTMIGALAGAAVLIGVL